MDEVYVIFDNDRDLPLNGQDKLAKVMISTSLLQGLDRELGPNIFNIPETKDEKDKLFEKLDGVLTRVMKGVGEQMFVGSGHRCTRLESEDFTLRPSTTEPISDVSFKMTREMRVSNPRRWDCFDVQCERIDENGALHCLVVHTKR